jgi:hypothetical protein
VGTQHAALFAHTRMQHVILLVYQGSTPGNGAKETLCHAYMGGWRCAGHPRGKLVKGWVSDVQRVARGVSRR